jgi:glutaryl-CoA dehydrogenase
VIAGPPPKFCGADYYDTESLLSEEEILVRNTVREFVDENVPPVIEKHYRAGTFPMPLARQMAELGMFGSTLPAALEVPAYSGDIPPAQRPA